MFSRLHKEVPNSSGRLHDVLYAVRVAPEPITMCGILYIAKFIALHIYGNGGHQPHILIDRLLYKLRAWDLDRYAKVCLLDTDIL